MSIDAALRDLLREAAAEGARIALAERDAGQSSSLIPIARAGVSRRALLAAAKRGELAIHRRGHAAFVERDDLERWLTSGSRSSATRPDAIGDVISLNRDRRRRKTA